MAREHAVGVYQRSAERMGHGWFPAAEVVSASRAYVLAGLGAVSLATSEGGDAYRRPADGLRMARFPS